MQNLELNDRHLESVFAILEHPMESAMSVRELCESDLEQTTAGKSTWASSESGALLIRSLTSLSDVGRPTIWEFGRAVRRDRAEGLRAFT